MEEIKVNLDNLTNEERETLLKLVEKGNKRVKRWRSERNGTYYSVSNCGEIKKEFDNMSTYDNQCYKLGNYFETEDEVEFARNKQYIYQQLADYALSHNTRVINLDDYTQPKWYMRYDIRCKFMRYQWTTSMYYMNQIYFTSEEIARAAVEEIGEDNIKKYLFGVNE